ncbi:MAG: hypothetical protein KGI29_09985 [Pseudomonadota bacterium]|nr:hypothetical protein [Pseudomonadota bacterium]MDE3038397.1 hypothetical protein [Pseudomonadota bacterium]
MAILSGCDMLGIKNPFDASRPEQRVVGPLRVPVLNQQDMTVPAAPLPVMVQPPPPAINPSDASPYDYYDQEGHPVAPKETAHVPPPQGSFLGGMLGDSNNNGNTQVRKPLPDNPLYPYGNIPSPSSSLPVLPSENVPPPPAVTGSTQPDAVLGQPPQKQSSPLASSLLTRLFGGNDDTLSPADKAAEKAPYPALSSVPPTPPQLQAARAANPRGMQQLQSDWTSAQQDKQALDSEPSSLPLAAAD